jgi:hypothetical protein
MTESGKAPFSINIGLENFSLQPDKDAATANVQIIISFLKYNDFFMVRTFQVALQIYHKN